MVLTDAPETGHAPGGALQLDETLVRPYAPVGGRAHRGVIALALLSIVAAIVVVSQQGPCFEYLPTARACAEQNSCHSHGAMVEGDLPLYHGAAFLHLMSFSHRVGGSQALAQDVIIVLLIASAALMFFLLRRYLGLPAATLLLGIYVPVMLCIEDFYIFTYPNVLPIVFVTYFTGVALFVEQRRPIYAVLGGIALGAAISVELGAAIMMPFHALLILTVARRPLPTLAASFGAAAVVFIGTSAESALALIRIVPTPAFGFGLAISGVGVAIIARRAARLFSTPIAVADQVRGAMAAALVYGVSAVWLGGPILGHNPPMPRFFSLSVIPFLFLVADGLTGIGRRTYIVFAVLELIVLSMLPFSAPVVFSVGLCIEAILTVYAVAVAVGQVWPRIERVAAKVRWPFAVICAALIAGCVAQMIVFHFRGPSQAFTFAESERLAPKLYSAGYTYADLMSSLQGPSADSMLMVLAARDPALFSGPSRPLSAPQVSLLALKVPNPKVSHTRDIIAQTPGGPFMSAIVVRMEKPYLDWIHALRCGAELGYRCAMARTDRPLVHKWPFIELGDPMPLRGLDVPKQWYVQRAHFEVPLEGDGRGVPHIIRVANEWPWTWQITRVTGVDFEGRLPATEIRVPDTRKGRGVVEFDMIQHIGDLPWSRVPHVMEVTQSNEHLLESFRHAR